MKKNTLLEYILTTYTCFSFIVQIENIMHKACLGELMGCTLSMCLLGYYSILVR